MTTTSKRQIIQNDWLGLTNIRLLNSEEPADYTRVESASLKVTSKFYSPEGKRMFLRLFVSAQLQFNFIGGVARAMTGAGAIDPLINSFRVLVDDLHKQLNEAIDGAELLFKHHGITQIASYDTPPLEVEVPIVSALARRYYEAIVKFDQLMPLLQTLQIHEIVTDQEILEWRARLKGEFRHVASKSRYTADRLRSSLFMVAKAGQTAVAATQPTNRQAASNKASPNRPAAKGSNAGHAPAQANARPPKGSPGPKPSAKQSAQPPQHGTEKNRNLFSAAARKRHNKRITSQAEAAAHAVGQGASQRQAYVEGHAERSSGTSDHGADTGSAHEIFAGTGVADNGPSQDAELLSGLTARDTGHDDLLVKINGQARVVEIEEGQALDAMHPIDGSTHPLESDPQPDLDPGTPSDEPVQAGIAPEA